MAGNGSATSHMRTHCCVDVDGRWGSWAGSEDYDHRRTPRPAITDEIPGTEVALVDRRNPEFFELGSRFSDGKVQPRAKLLRLHAGRQGIDFHEFLEDTLKFLDTSACDFHGTDSYRNPSGIAQP